MRTEYLSAAVAVMRFLLAVLSGGMAVWVFKYLRKKRGESKEGTGSSWALQGEEHGGSLLREFHYASIERFLRTNGVAQLFFIRMTPGRYLGIKLILALSGAFLGLKLNFLLMLPAAAAGFKLMDLIVLQSNKKDNEALLEDIRNLYDVLRIQTRAGSIFPRL